MAYYIKYISLIILICFSSKVLAQDEKHCATRISDPEDTPKLKISDNEINIPIFFHVIYNSDGEGDVSRSKLKDQMDVLNTEFKNTNFNFYLAGISRTQNDNWWDLNLFEDDTKMNNMKDKLNIDPDNAINVYVNNLSNYAGQAQNDAVIIEYTTLPNGGHVDHDEGDLLVHEVGHYFGLLHTFYEPGVCKKNSEYEGDKIADTPWEKYASVGCDDTDDTCKKSDNPIYSGEDPIHNLMNYTDDPCRYKFTKDQIERMHKIVADNRPSLGGTVLNFNNSLTIDTNQEYKFFDTTFRFAQDKGVTADGRLDIHNSTIKRKGSNAWDAIELNSPNNIIDNTIISGGFNGLEVNGDNTVIKNSMIKNHSNNGISASADFDIINTTIENVDGPGISAIGATLDLKHVTIKGNTMEGIFVYDSDINTLYKSVIKNNSNAVKVLNGGHVYVFDSGDLEGYTRFEDNQQDEVYIYSSAYQAGVTLGIEAVGVGGGNAIYDSNDSADPWDDEKYILNNTSETVYAENVYWNTTEAGEISGHLYNQNVEWDPYLSSDPTTNSGASSNKSIKYPELTTITSTSKSEGKNKQSSRITSQEVLGELEQKISRLQKKMLNNPYSEQIDEQIVQLYTLQHIDHEDKAGVKDRTMKILKSWKQRLSDQQQLLDQPSEVKDDVVDAAETAILLLGKEARVNDDPDKVVQLHKEFSEKFTYPNNRRSLALNKVSALIVKQDYSGAAQALQSYSRLIPEINEAQAKAYNKIAEFIQRNGNINVGSIESRQKRVNADKFAPEKFKLKSVYPNPFNPTTVVPFVLPKEAHIKIKVFNELGQEVKMLVNKRFDKGNHSIKFHAGDLPSGLYFIQLETDTKLKDHSRLLKKVTLIK